MLFLIDYMDKVLSWAATICMEEKNNNKVNQELIISGNIKEMVQRVI